MALNFPFSTSHPNPFKFHNQIPNFPTFSDMALNFPFRSFTTSRPNPFSFHNQIPNFPIPSLPISTNNMFLNKLIRIQLPDIGLPPVLQNFQYFVIVDFEATCDKEKPPHPQEIIEFPAVIVEGRTGEIRSCFQTYVRPTCNPVLTDFCKELTGIQQFQVDNGISLREALFLHDKWLDQMGVKNTNFAVVTWSNWDCQVMLESECRFKKIQKPDYFNKWINLRIPFRQVFGDVRCNLQQAVEIAGLAWQGRVHCGLDDAINISRLFSVIMQKGYKFSITKSLLKTNPLILEHQKIMAPLQLHPLQLLPPQIHQDIRHCFCGARSMAKMMKKAGPKQGKFFFGCGRWTATRGACCDYFEWIN